MRSYVSSLASRSWSWLLYFLGLAAGRSGLGLGLLGGAGASVGHSQVLSFPVRVDALRSCGRVVPLVVAEAHPGRGLQLEARSVLKLSGSLQPGVIAPSLSGLPLFSLGPFTCRVFVVVSHRATPATGLMRSWLQRMTSSITTSSSTGVGQQGSAFERTTHKSARGDERADAEARGIVDPVMTFASEPSARRRPPRTSSCYSSIARDRSQRL